MLKTFVDGNVIYSRILRKNEKIIVDNNHEIKKCINVFGEEKTMLLKIK